MPRKPYLHAELPHPELVEGRSTMTSHAIDPQDRAPIVSHDLSGTAPPNSKQPGGINTHGHDLLLRLRLALRLAGLARARAQEGALRAQGAVVRPRRHQGAVVPRDQSARQGSDHPA